MTAKAFRPEQARIIADIIASKRAAGRKRDLAELDLLEEFSKVYEAAKHARKPA